MSLGSSRRDAKVEIPFGSETLLVERMGMDGDFRKAKALIEQWDGKASAFGLGGIDLYLHLGKRRYTISDARRLEQAAKITPVADGSGLKHTLEAKVVESLPEKLSLRQEETVVLLVSAVDRYGMAEAFCRMGFPVIFGDLIYALGVPIPLRSLTALHILGSLLLPIVVRLPFHILYPVGKKQEKRNPRGIRWFQQAKIIAGDFHFIRKYAPLNLKGKIILTNTTTEADVEDLSRRGISCLITTTPVYSGRSFGTNVLEACLFALKGLKKGESLPGKEYENFCQQYSVQPNYRFFSSRESE